MTTAADHPLVAHGDPAPESAPTHRCDVLIADDTGASREILASLLRQSCPEITIREVRDGTGALALWRQLLPRVTFLDIDMPGQNGLTVLETIRSGHPSAFIAMVSGNSSPDNVRKALSMGASGFIVKPYKPQRVIDVLERYGSLSGHKLVTSG
ncbi:response regulator transcription factor [Ideonella sp. A 288]|uniref:response regulator transcription factor n=1 Tax=Ideonella sp. A 288 TaxID=1962181 RepID=UPI000B4BFAD7|nr:response regulator [Ideonella sp. A 288]